MQHTHELMRYIIEHNRIAVAVHDKNLNYMYVSRPYIEFFGLEGQEIIGNQHYEIMPSMPEKWKEVHQRVFKRKIITSGDTESFMKQRMLVKRCSQPIEDSLCIGP